MFQPIIAHGATLGIDQYVGTNEEAELCLLALRSYGFLLRPSDQNVKRYSFQQFADLIEVNYDLDEPRNKAVHAALLSLEARNNSAPVAAAEQQ